MNSWKETESLMKSKVNVIMFKKRVLIKQD